VYQELENTREGFQKCADMGADAVELDIFLLKCGTLIVFHGAGNDANPGQLLEYCGMEGNILDLTYEEALQLTFNPSYAEFPCPDNSILAGKIPTLEQVLVDAKKSGLHIKIELKGPGTVEPTLELVDRLDMVEQCSFSAFDLDRLAHFRRLRPQRDPETGEHVYKTGTVFSNLPEDYIEQAQAAGASEIHLRYDTCTLEAITAIHEAGFGSMAWFRGPIGMSKDCLEKNWDVGNEGESMYEVLLRSGVQQMCINKPDTLINLRDKLQTIHPAETDKLRQWEAVHQSQRA
jgi:glycerophosphoryl diester phosphodiesterase